MIDLEAQAVNELQNIRVGQESQARIGPQAPTPTFSGRGQASFSPYSMYTGAAAQDAAAQGLYMPEPNIAGIPISPYTTNAANSATNYLREANVKQALFNFDRNRVSQQSRDLAGMQAGQNILGATLAGGNALAGVVGNFAGTSLLGAAGIGGSLLGGAIGGAVGGLFFSTAANQVALQSQYSNYLFQNSYRFIDPYESTNNRYGMGFSNQDRSDASSYLRNLSTQKLVSSGDMQTMLSGFVDNNLLSDVSNLKTFKDKMSKLVDTVKTSALLLNDSYKDVVKMMGEMDRAGISTNNFDYMMGKIKTLTSFTGATPDQTINSVGTLSGSKTGTALDPLTQMNNSVLALRMMQELKVTANAAGQNSSLGYLNNLYANAPGDNASDKLTWLTQQAGANMQSVLGSATVQTLAAGLFNYNSQTRGFDLDYDAYNKLKSGKMSYSDLMKTAEKKGTSWGDATVLQWQNGAALDSLNGLTLTQLSTVVPDIVTQIGQATQNGNTDIASILTQMGLGTDDNGRKLFADYYGSVQKNGDIYQSEMSMLGWNQSMQAKMDAQSEGIWQSIQKFFNQIGDKIGNAFAPVESAAENLGVALKDLWNGTTPMNRYQISVPVSFDPAVQAQNVQNQANNIQSFISSAGSGLSSTDAQTINAGLSLAQQGNFSTSDNGVYGYTMSNIMSVNQINKLASGLNIINTISKDGTYNFDLQANSTLTSGSQYDVQTALGLNSGTGNDDIKSALLQKYTDLITQLGSADANGLSNYERVAGNKALQDVIGLLSKMGTNVTNPGMVGLGQYASTLYGTGNGQYNGNIDEYYKAMSNQYGSNSAIGGNSSSLSDSLDIIGKQVDAAKKRNSISGANIRGLIYSSTDPEAQKMGQNILDIMNAVDSGTVTPEDALNQLNALSPTGQTAQNVLKSVMGQMVGDQGYLQSSGVIVSGARTTESVADEQDRMLGVFKEGSLLSGFLGKGQINDLENKIQIKVKGTQGEGNYGADPWAALGQLFSPKTVSVNRIGNGPGQYSVKDLDISAGDYENMITEIVKTLTQQFDAANKTDSNNGIASMLQNNQYLHGDNLQALLNLENTNSASGWQTEDISALAQKIIEQMTQAGAGETARNASTAAATGDPSKDIVSSGNNLKNAVSQYTVTVQQTVDVFKAAVQKLQGT